MEERTKELKAAAVIFAEADQLTYKSGCPILPEVVGGDGDSYISRGLLDTLTMDELAPGLKYTFLPSGPHRDDL